MSRSQAGGPLPSPDALTRRRFVAGAAGAAIAAAARRLPAEEPRPIVRLGLVGAGGRGRWIGRLFRDHGGYALHAVADYFPDVAEAAGNDLGADPARRFSGLDGYRRLLASGVQAVALETPPCFFPAHARAAVEAGVHVYMAKPIAVDVPGVRQVEAAARLAQARGLSFLVDYQMPTDPHNVEIVRRAREGAVGRPLFARSHYWGGAFPDPPRTATLESRLRHLVWCNDVAVGGGYHVNACIHPVQAMLWALGRTPVRALGASRFVRPEPHGDSHDAFSLTYEFDDGLLWSHVGKHWAGLTAPEDAFSACEVFGDAAYLRIGYSGRALLRGGPQQYAGGDVQNLYQAGAVRNIAAFHKAVTGGPPAADTLRLAVDSALVTILGREAALRREALTLDQVLKENRRLDVDLTGLKA